MPIDDKAEILRDRVQAHGGFHATRADAGKIGRDEFAMHLGDFPLIDSAAEPIAPSPMTMTSYVVVKFWLPRTLTAEAAPYFRGDVSRDQAVLSERGKSA